MYLAFLGFLFMVISFSFNSPAEILEGSAVILMSPANLLTDYFQLANIGAAFMNSGIMILISVVFVRKAGLRPDGSIVAAIFTIAGFSFFGKNFYNSIPIAMGVMVYARLIRKPFKNYILQALFGTALGPVVSEITFNMGLPFPTGGILGIAAGMLAGFVLPPLSAHFIKFHQGYNLYNIGFTAGIIGMFFLAVIRLSGVDVAVVSILSSGNNTRLEGVFLPLFGAMVLGGIVLNDRQSRGLRVLLAQTGRLPSDFTAIAGPGPVLINMGGLGLISTFFVLAMGGELNGPVIGGIFTVVGFGAFGKHILNVIPILTGVSLAGLLNVYDPSSTTVLLGALFGTTLAPITGRYGFAAGILAGFLHMAVVTNVHYLHGGMNLYNNGFAGGFIAAALVPLLDAAAEIRNHFKDSKQSP